MAFHGEKTASVVEAIKYLTFPSKLSGMFPVIVGERKITLSLLMIIVSLFINVVYITALSFTSLYMFNLPQQTYVSIASNYVEIFVFGLIPLIAMTEVICSLKTFSIAVKKIQDIETLVVLLGEKPNYNITMMFIWVQGILFCTSLFFGYNENVVTKKNITTSSLLTFYFSVIYFVTVILVQRYCSLLWIVMSLNESCKKLLLSTMKLAATSGHVVERLEALTQAHNRLCESSELIHTSHSLQIFTVIFSCFFACITETFQVVAVLQGWSQIHKYYTLFESLSWALKCFLPIWQIAAICTKCRETVSSYI